MSKEMVVVYSASKDNPEVKKNDDFTQVIHLKGKRILYNKQKNVVIIGIITIDYHQDVYGMADSLIMGIASDSMLLSNALYDVRTAHIDDFIGGVASFQTLLQERIAKVTLEDLHSVTRLEDVFLADFHDCMTWHTDLTDENEMVEAVSREMGYPRWFDLFDSMDGAIETMTMFAKKFIEEKLWFAG